PMSPLAVEPDHLVVGALDLTQGCDWIEQQLGVRPQPGGKHVAMGTHNALLSLGPRFFLEVIAVDPEGVKPARPRWFDLDEPRVKAALAGEVGGVTPVTRGDFTWRITIPDDGRRPWRGLVPTVIEWADARHPTD